MTRYYNNVQFQSLCDKYINLIEIDNESVKELAFNRVKFKDIRHKCSNWEAVLDKVKEDLGYNPALKSSIANVVKNAINDDINKLIVETIHFFYNLAKEFEKENKQLKTQFKDLQKAFITRLNRDQEVEESLRIELGKAIQSKEQYITFIAELCDCSYEDAEEIGK